MHGLRRSKIVILCKTEPKYYISSKFLIKGTFTNPWFHNQKYAGCLFSNKDDWLLKKCCRTKLDLRSCEQWGGFENGRKVGDDLRPVAPWRRPPAPHNATQSTPRPPRRQIIGKFLVLAETGGHVTNGDLPLSAVIRNKYSGGGSQVGLLHS